MKAIKLLRASFVGALVLVLTASTPDSLRTLRIDYIFAGRAGDVRIFLDDMHDYGLWAGRRHNLKSIPVEGNGQITMVSAATGDTLYRNSFCTLFQEWLNTEEATKVDKAFENTFLLPMPSEKAVVNICLEDNHRRKVASFTHEVDPSDILIRKHNFTKLPDHRAIISNGPSSEKIDIVVIAEGYTAQERELFYRDADAATEAIFRHEPFKSRRGDFNVTAVALESQESGVSVPHQGVWKDVALDSNFDTFYMNRYLTTLSIGKIYDAIGGIPCEHIVIIANTETYGGGGIYNSYTLSTAHNARFAQVVAHEFGHSFGALGDEYAYDDMYEIWYPAGIEPWEQNITTMTDFASKWQDMLGVKARNGDCSEFVVSTLEGAGYQSKGAWRPVEECIMRVFHDKEKHETTFCPVCSRAINRIIDFNTQPCITH